MDDFSIHVAHLPRRFPSALTLDQLGFLRQKRYQVRQSFSTVNFSCVLHGRGSYWFEGAWYDVVAPCVLMQMPGQACDYGPQGAWEELYLIYPAAVLPALERMHIALPTRPLWQVQGPVLREAARALQALCSGGPLGPLVDQLDRAAERLLIDSLCAATAPNDQVAALERVRAHLAADPLHDHDVHALARAQGLSPTVFRRLWNRALGVPPARYLATLRIQAACRALVETNASVADIAKRCGYPDPLHFSRRFHALIGEAPSAYRSRYRRELVFVHAGPEGAQRGASRKRHA